MKTPEQIAAEVTKHTYIEGLTKREQANIHSAMIRAIEEDRKQRENETIAEKRWVLEDFRNAGIMDTLEVDYPNITEAQREEIVQSAPDYLTRWVLEDCTDRDWEAINDALFDAARDLLGEPTHSILTAKV